MAVLKFVNLLQPKMNADFSDAIVYNIINLNLGEVW
jgi:hypothetical protein